MNNLSKIVMHLCPKKDLNPRPVDIASPTLDLPVAPPRHLVTKTPAKFARLDRLMRAEVKC